MGFEDAAQFVRDNGIFDDLNKEESQLGPWLSYQFVELRKAVIFDCRKLPHRFIADTGEATFDEMRATQQCVKLPFETCYFEFEGQMGTLVSEADNGLVRLFFYEWIDDGEFLNIGAAHGSFNNGIEFRESGPPQEYEPFFFLCNTENPFTQAGLLLHARHICGVLSLMSDKLLSTEVRPDPAPRLTKARLRRGTFPVTAETRVLTVNVSAVRRLASKTAVGKHESPCLHWRRGHWKVLHRGSEFEKRAWWSKTLVGDPDKGYVKRNYKLVSELPMLKPTDALH